MTANEVLTQLADSIIKHLDALPAQDIDRVAIVESVLTMTLQAEGFVRLEYIVPVNSRYAAAKVE